MAFHAESNVLALLFCTSTQSMRGSRMDSMATMRFADCKCQFPDGCSSLSTI